MGKHNMKESGILQKIDAGKNGKGFIRLNDIHKSFTTAAGEFQVLKGITADFDEGEFVGVIGKSGSGKSTLINMISGIDRPSSGGVFIGDTAVHELSENQMAIWRGRNLGIVFQFFQLLPMLSLIENIMLPMDFCNMYSRKERVDRAMYLLETVELADHADKLPTAISGGQQQRVAIARALANDPPVIIADEPTGNLDSQTAESVFNLFEDLIHEGKTILMVTHDIAQAKRVTRTVLIADGELVNEWVYRALPSLSTKQLVEASHQVKAKKYKPGQPIMKEDEPGDNFYIVTKGNVEVALKQPTNGDIVVTRMGPGEYFGEIEILRGGNAIATVRAAEVPVSVLTMDRETFNKLLLKSKSTKDVIEQIVNKRVNENISFRGREA